MGRHEERQRELLENEAAAGGYKILEAERVLLDALDDARLRAGVGMPELLKRLGRDPEPLTHVAQIDYASPDLDTLFDMFSIVGVKATISLSPIGKAEPLVTMVASGAVLSGASGKS